MVKQKLLLLLLITVPLFAGTNTIEKNGKKYFSGVVVIKLKSQNNTLNKNITLQKELKKFGINKITEFVKTNDENLRKIFLLKYTKPLDPEYISAKLARKKEIDWAEPLYVRKVTDTPNDTYFSKQYFLSKIEIEKAWDITKGNANIILAIVDTGVDWNHEDLAGHIWQNDDPINGVDDDNNGYIDDIHGWDFGGIDGTPDNDPKEDAPTHGTHVAGIAAAVTNNSKGVAGAGYNLTIMPVKTTRHDVGDRSIVFGYQGIIYAADNGADIINCSWGGSGYSRAEQEIINYAIAKGVVIIASAGNDGKNDVLFPAAYKGVLSVGNTDSEDKISTSSNYGYKLDVCAPGTSIYSTWQSNTYTFLSGTSMSSPLIAGVAGLVIDKYPDYTPLQIIEQIRSNADNIDALNSGKEFMLGSGRVNAYKALSNGSVKSVRVDSVEFVEINNPDGIFEAGDEVEIKLKFINFLSPLTALSVDLSSNDPNVTVTASRFSTSAKGTLESFDNYNQTFKFKINDNSANDKEVFFKITYSDGTYSDFEYISLNINPTYRTQSGNKIALTVTSKGTLGFNDYPSNLQGSGFTYMKGDNLLFEGGLMYGNSDTTFADAVRSANTDYQSNDFKPLSFVQINIPGTIADQECISEFNDDNAGESKPGIKTVLKTYTFSDNGNDNYIILKYIFTNNSINNYTNFYAGIFFDWDINGNGYDKNITRFNSQNNFGYVYHETKVLPYIAMALLSDGTTGFYGIQNNGEDGGLEIYKNFTDTEKWTALSNGLNKTDAGPQDVSCVISAGPYNLNSGESLEIAFSVNAALSLEELQKSVVNGKKKYESLLTDLNEDVPELPEKFILKQNYPNPFNPATTINYSIAKRGLVQLKIYDVLGKKIITLVNKIQKSGKYSVDFNANELSSGVYFYKLQWNNFSVTKKMILLK
jgi:subtilisin family serine protease